MAHKISLRNIYSENPAEVVASWIGDGPCWKIAVNRFKKDALFFATYGWSDNLHVWCEDRPNTVIPSQITFSTSVQGQEVC